MNVWDFLDWQILAVIAMAVPFGLVCGLLPGVSGITALAILLPFAARLEPLYGLCFLLAAHAVVYTGGSVTAVLFGIPGAPANAAIVADGHALARLGHGPRAAAVAVMVSGLGGLMGCLFLIAMLPLMRLALPLIGSPETFFLAVVGLVCAARIGGRDVVKGLIAASIGLLLGTIGYQSATGVPRFWFGVEHLLDGIGLVPMVTGLFAGPELVALATGAFVIDAAAGGGLKSQLRAAWRDVVARRWLVAKASIVGAAVGVTPGVGGEAAPFLAYAWTKPKPSGDLVADHIDGVAAPESAANAKEGGSLVPTLALGVPGSAGMAVLLAAFPVFGIDPGPTFMREHGDIVGGLAFTLALSNVVGALAMLALAPLLVRVVRLRPAFLVPLVVTFATMGIVSARGSLADLLIAALFAALGIFMRRFGYNRPSLVLGVVLAPLLETYFNISLGAYGALFFLRPLSLCLLVVIAIMLARPGIKFLRNRSAP